MIQYCCLCLLRIWASVVYSCSDMRSIAVMESGEIAALIICVSRNYETELHTPRSSLRTSE